MVIYMVYIYIYIYIYIYKNIHIRCFFYKKHEAENANSGNVEGNKKFNS